VRNRDAAAERLWRGARSNACGWSLSRLSVLTEPTRRARLCAHPCPAAQSSGMLLEYRWAGLRHGSQLRMAFSLHIYRSTAADMKAPSTAHRLERR
jgi:hypothetical protein